MKKNMVLPVKGYFSIFNDIIDKEVDMLLSF